MKKFECTRCPHRKCTSILEDDLCSPPQSCVNKYVPLIPDWHEVKAETTTKSSQLPDWCKAGKWIYDNVIGEYAIVKKEENQQWYIDNLKTLSPARKHQFDKKEMQGLVGKVFTTPDGDVSIATDFDNIMNSICICSEWFKGDELANSIWQLDGKPCYKLEHLENGEWVE